MSKANTLFIGLNVHKETTDVAWVSDKSAVASGSIAICCAVALNAGGTHPQSSGRPGQTDKRDAMTLARLVRRNWVTSDALLLRVH